MKKLVLAVLILISISACNNESKVKEEVDSLGKEIDSTFSNVRDSAGKSLKNLKRRIEDEFDKDTLKD